MIHNDPNLSGAFRIKIPAIIAICGLLLSAPSYALPKTPNLNCGQQPSADRQVLCEKLESIMTFSTGYHAGWFGLPSPGFSIPDHAVSTFFCKENISLKHAPALAGMVVDQHLFENGAPPDTVVILGQTAGYLMALLGPDALTAIPATDVKPATPQVYAARAARLSISIAMTGSAFAPGMPEHSRSTFCKP